MKLKKIPKKSWISLATGVGLAGFLPLLWDKYAQWENGLVVTVKNDGSWGGLLKGTVEKTDFTKQTDVDRLNKTIKLTQSVVVGGLSMGLSFGIDSVMHKKITFNPMVLGLSFALGFVVRYAVPNPKRIALTVTPVNPDL